MNTQTVHISLEQAYELNNALVALQELSPETASALEVQAGVKLARVQKLSAALLHKASIIGVNVQELVRTFLARFQSTSTQATYKRGITVFMNWAEEQGIRLLEVSGTDADNYASFASQTYSPRTANTYINAVSSLYAWLFKRGHIRATPFVNIKRSTAPASKTVPSQADIDRAIARSSERVGSAIAVLAATGIRLGALTCPKAELQGRTFTSLSKGGKRVAVRVSEHTAGLIERWLPAWSGMRTNTLSLAIHRAFRAVGASASAHGLRHAFAVRLYTESAHNIELLRRALGHSNIAITTTYLQSLEISAFSVEGSSHNYKCSGRSTRCPT